MSEWLLDERAYAGPEHLDPDSVARYDAKAAVDVEETLALLDLRPEPTLVDLGAGTGTIASAAAAHCRRVVAVDPSPAMIDVLRARGLEAVEAGFLTYEHEGDPPAVVHSRHAVHHLPDFWKGIALARVYDLLAPGGTFVLRDLVYDFDPRVAGRHLEEWLAGAARSAGTGWTRAELEEHIRTEHSTYGWLLASLLERAGFEIRDELHRGVYATYVCAKR
jgi:SAM-dependent methyltransferase